MRKILLLLIIACVCFSGTFEDIKYDVVAENDGFIVVQVERNASLNAQNTIDYIKEAEEQFNIEFVCVYTASLYLFRKKSEVKQ